MKSFLRRWIVLTAIFAVGTFLQLAFGTRFKFDEPLEVWIILILAPPVLGAIIAAIQLWDEARKARKAAQ